MCASNHYRAQKKRQFSENFFPIETRAEFKNNSVLETISRTIRAALADEVDDVIRVTGLHY